MNIGLRAEKRDEDVTRMLFSDIYAGRLFVTQSNTGHKLANPLGHEQKSVGMSLEDAIELCRNGNSSDNLV